jgi:LacI family transcriptional regulator
LYTKNVENRNVLEGGCGLMATIKDVAKKTGLSVTTVSRALNDFNDVKVETKRRIKLAAEELGYRPNAVARRLVMKKTRTIGVILSEIQPSMETFSFAILCGVNGRAVELDYDIMLLSTTPKKQMAKSYYDLCRERNVDGAIIFGLRINDPYLHEVVQKNHFPSVLIDIPLSGDNLGHVTTDNVHGSVIAMRHLLELGHREIAMINGHNEAHVSKERLEGYIQALQEHNIPFRPERVLDGQFSEEGGAVAMQQILERCPEVTAVFSASDLMVLGALQTLERNGKKAPDDMSIVGYDDITISAYSSPKLTTIRQDKYEMGYQAAQLLIDMLEGKPVDHKIVLPNELVVRNSARPV